MTELQRSEAWLAKLIEDKGGSILAEGLAEVAALEGKMHAGSDRLEAVTRRNNRTRAGGPAGHDGSKTDNAINKQKIRVSRLKRAVRKHW
jgi:hypothetical protein